MKKFVITAVTASAISLAAGSAFADFAADTNGSLQGCPEMVYENGHAKMYAPPNETLSAEPGFLKHCPTGNPALGTPQPAR